MTRELAFVLADVCGNCAVTQQAGAVSRLICLNMWGAASLLPHGLRPRGNGWGRGSTNEKQSSFQLPLVNKVDPSPLSRHVTAAWHVLSHYPLARVVNPRFNNRRLRRCWPLATPELSEPLVHMAPGAGSRGVFWHVPCSLDLSWRW